MPAEDHIHLDQIKFRVEGFAACNENGYESDEELEEDLTWLIEKIEELLATE